jgi:hypothetical protein
LKAQAQVVKLFNREPLNRFYDLTIQRFNESRFGFRFAEAGDAVAVFALAAFFEEFRAFKTLEDIAFAAQGGRCAQAAML